MGCLNSSSSFEHVFGNIHLSGPCNRRCYFCIGQHMMALDSFNNLNEWPLKNIDLFVAQCNARNVTEINVTGTNTDGLLYKHTPSLRAFLLERIPKLRLGVRTNGAANLSSLKWYDKASVTVCSLKQSIHTSMMGYGEPAPIAQIMHNNPQLDLKVNIVLGPENIGDDLWHTLDYLSMIGIKRINIREPYGQPHVGDPLANRLQQKHKTFGMATYAWNNSEVTYWDVHYVEVESINLYANGNVSSDYPITRGHDLSGKVFDQSHFTGGRINEQWVTLKIKNKL